jgi:DNA-binding NarL/FixJ family response regulator
MPRRSGVAQPAAGETAAPSAGESVASSEARGPISVAVAGEPGLLRDLLCRLLSAEPALRPVGAAGPGGEADRLIRRERPRVLLLDFEGSGAEAARTIGRLRRPNSSTRVVLLTACREEELARQALRAGASGIFLKSLGSDALIRAIRAVADGEVWADRHATAQAIEELAGSLGRVPVPADPLTGREREIAEGVAQGLRNKEIARRLRITEKTVKSHLHHIFRKLQVDNRFAVGLYTLERGGETERD